MAGGAGCVYGDAGGGAVKCFYHSSDLDGWCSGAIVKNKYPECELRGVDYGDKFSYDGLMPGEKVFMVDFCLQPYDLMAELNYVCDLTWIDHHKSAIEEHKKRPLRTANTLLEVGKAACELTWKLLFGNTVPPRVVTLLGRYDVWDHSDSMTLPFQYGMRLRANDPIGGMDFWKFLFKTFPEDILLEGQTILDYVMQDNSKYTHACAFETSLDGLRCIAINRMLTNSQMFDSVWGSDQYDAMLTFGWRKGKWTVSLYSDKDTVDVSVVAKARGGGGHKGAAGFQCQELPFELI